MKQMTQSADYMNYTEEKINKSYKEMNIVQKKNMNQTALQSR